MNERNYKHCLIENEIYGKIIKNHKLFNFDWFACRFSNEIEKNEKRTKNTKYLACGF